MPDCHNLYIFPRPTLNLDKDNMTPSASKEKKTLHEGEGTLHIRCSKICLQSIIKNIWVYLKPNDPLILTNMYTFKCTKFGFQITKMFTSIYLLYIAFMFKTQSERAIRGTIIYCYTTHTIITYMSLGKNEDYIVSMQTKSDDMKYYIHIKSTTLDGLGRS
ncbi:hypothetical protein ACJX0J_014027 [Zea mays]